MMVNHLNNNTLPWQSTIPNQMPWLDSCPTTSQVMQFGQAAFNPTSAVPTPSINTTLSGPGLPFHQPLLNSAPHPSMSAPTPSSSPNPLMPGNPFDPQLLASQYVTSANTQLIAGQLDQPAKFPPGASASAPQQDGSFITSSLTQLPHVQPGPLPQSSPNQKRSSIEMEDEQTSKEAPPTKQQLSENKLFRRFGTLRLNGESLTKSDDDEELDSDSSEDSGTKESPQDRKDFDRYVYLLFKDKKSNNLFERSTSGAMDKLIRDEREKLSKAVILWSPPMKNSIFGNLGQQDDDDDDDDEFRYKDHRDFLKQPSERDPEDDSIIITEVEDDVPIEEVDQIETDEMMGD